LPEINHIYKIFHSFLCAQRDCTACTTDAIRRQFNFYQSFREVFFLLKTRCQEICCYHCIITWPLLYLRSQLSFWALSMIQNWNCATRMGGNVETQINKMSTCCPY